MLTVRDGDKVLAARQITFASDGQTQNESLLFNAGDAGAQDAPIHDRSASGGRQTAPITASRDW